MRGRQVASQWRKEIVDEARIVKGGIEALSMRGMPFGDSQDVL